MSIRSESEVEIQPENDQSAGDGPRLEGFGKKEDKRQWQAAGDRMLLYLRCLNLPYPQALEFALQALKEADQTIRKGSDRSPMAESMQILYRLLEEQKPEILARNRFFLDTWCRCSPRPSPPLRRLPMVTKKLISSPRPLVTKRLSRRN